MPVKEWGDRTMAVGRRNGLGDGTLSAGISGLIGRFLLFVALPSICVFFLITIAGSEAGGNAMAFKNALYRLEFLLLVAGSAASIVGAVASYHLRRTKARLYLGLLYVATLVVYAAALFLAGPMSDALGALGWDYPMLLPFVSALFVISAIAFRFLREYRYFSSTNAAGQGEEWRPELGWGEFDLRVGDTVPGLASAERYILRNLLRTQLILIVLIGFLYICGFDRSGIEGRFLQVVMDITALFLFMGIPLVILAFFKGYYPKGTRSRVFFNLATSLLYLFLLFWVFVGSGLDQFLLDNGLNVPLFPMALAIVIWAAIEVLLANAEFDEERANWLQSAGHTPPVKAPPVKKRERKRLRDFDLSLGNAGRGLKAARKELLLYIVIPEAIIVMGIALVRSLAIGGTNYNILGSWTIIVLGAGMLVTFVGFWRGFYPPGSYSRLASGLMLVPAISLYFLALGMQGSFYEALRQMGIMLYTPGVELLIIIFIMLVAFRQVAEFADARRDWLQACGKEVRPYKPIPKMTRIQEFRVRFASKRDGVVWAGKGMVRYVFYTSIAIIFIITAIDSAVYFGTGMELKAFSSTLSHMFIGLVLIAIPLAASRAFYGFYPQGSISKLTAGYLMCGVGAFYTYSSFRGGTMTMVSEGDIMTAGVAIDFTFIVVLFTIGWMIWAVTVTAEYFAFREAWVANGYRPVVQKEEAQRIAFEKIVAKEGTRNVQLSQRELDRAARRAKRRGTTMMEEQLRELKAKEAGVHVAEEMEAAAEDEEIEAQELDTKGDEDETPSDI
jgi:hypothetical protein